MSSVALLLLAIAVLPAFGLSAWAWLAVVGAKDELRAFVNFEGMHVAS